MLADAVDKIYRGFGVELIDYDRQGLGVVISSGCGLGLAIMDVLPTARYFVDIDRYRTRSLDWEAVGVLLRCGNPSFVVLVGWYTIDVPQAMNAIELGLKGAPSYRYDGGGRESLGGFLGRLFVVGSQAPDEHVVTVPTHEHVVV